MESFSNFFSHGPSTEYDGTREKNDADHQTNSPGKYISHMVI